MLLVLWGALSCGDVLTLGPGEIVGLIVGPDSSEVPVGGSVRLTAAPVDSTGAFLPGLSIVWTSSNTAVASVDARGLVVGLGPGTTTVTASVDGFDGQAVVAVDLAPLIEFSADSVGFTSTAGQAGSGPDSVGITNAGGFVLTGLTLGTITYGAGADSWLSATLDSMEAPATVTLQPMAAAVTTAGTYTASVPVQSAVASNNPRALNVTLTVGADVPAGAAVNDGDAQTATVGTAVATAPSMLVTDQFGNPVADAAVTFAVAGGNGSVTGAAQLTGPDGVARVGSWTLGPTVGANALQGTVTGASPVVFSATGIAGAAAQISVSAGDNQSAVAGAAVAVPPAVLVADQFGNGVAGVTVTFAVATGGGGAMGTTPVSAASGVAAVGSWTLGGSAGVNTMTATAPGLTGSPITFTATGLSGSATDMSLTSGDAQSDTVGATLAQPYVARVTDTNGNGVAGIPVAWTVTSGGGGITPSSTTDAAGFASATRTLGTGAGAQTAEAAVGGLNGSPVVFTATATAGTATTIAANDGAGQTATVNTAVGVDPSVLVTDQFGNPVPGHDVTFAVTAGLGTVDPLSPITTDASGVARVTSWTLGTMAGTNNNTLQATAAGMGITGNPVSFTASGTAGAATTIAVFAGNNQTAVVNTAVPTDPAVLITDAFGNAVQGVAVTFAVTGGGGSLTGGSQTSAASGVATLTSWTLQAGVAMSDTGTFVNTLSATAAFGATSFTGLGVYSYTTHVQPIWTGSCTGCHGGVNGLFLNAPAATSHGNIVGVSSNCEPATDWIETGGGMAAEAASIILRLMDTNVTSNVCGTAGRMPQAGQLPLAVRDTIRAWIRNGAPLN